MICYNGDNGKSKFYVAIMASDLTSDPIKRLRDECGSCGELEMCVDKIRNDPGYKSFGFLRGISQLESLKRVINIETGENHSLDSPYKADFIVAGCRDRIVGGGISPRASGLSVVIYRVPVELFVMSAMDSGLLVARCSSSYGGKSELSGNLPEESGYSFDIPKNALAVKTLITDDSFLDALVSREEKKIKSAVKKFNKQWNEPVLITPFLKKALEVEK
ncbi:hypothetical protein KY319_03395 [Candidatus Woesearchaeota archaeon]|nr:hypothetical protein [Candidatus Woesearchaeota archaeon]